MADLLTEDELRAHLEKEVGDMSHERWGKEKALVPVSQSYVSDVLKGYRNFGDRMLEALGFERVTLYKRKAENETGNKRGRGV